MKIIITDFIRIFIYRYLEFEKLGIKVFSLDNFEEAMHELRKGVISKAVFKLTSGLEKS